jgi:hypothetical protein
MGGDGGGLAGRCVRRGALRRVGRLGGGFVGVALARVGDGGLVLKGPVLGGRVGVASVLLVVRMLLRLMLVWVLWLMLLLWVLWVLEAARVLYRIASARGRVASYAQPDTHSKRRGETA